MTDQQVQGRRRKVTSGEAAARASELIPDPAGVEAPPPERPAVSTRVDTPPASSSTKGAGAGDERGPWGSIIDAVLTVDPERTFDRLRAELSLEADHTSYAAVAAALDLADRRYFEASVLVRGAKLEEQRIDREVGMRMEVLRTAARQKIEDEKRTAAKETGSKASGKATLEEVRDRCYADWPDEVSALERRSQEYHAARAVAEELATAWRSRAASLRELVAGLRGR